MWLDRRTSVGAAFGAGIEFHLGMLRLDPSFRVTRWDSERTSSIGVTSRLAKTQAEVLLTVAHSVSGGRETPPARIPCCFEFGLLAGLPLLAASDVRSGVPGFPTSLDAPAYRYAVGALLDWRLQTRLSLEASFLTRPFGHTATTVYPSITDKESVSGYSWEVPLLLKWRAAKLRSATFVIGAGPVLLRASNAESTMTTSGSMFNSRFSEPLIVQSAIGATVSGGIELKAGRLRLRQEIRYQWFERPLYDFYFVKPRQDSLFVIFAVSQITR